MIQDIAPHKLYNQYDPSAKALPDDLLLILKGNRVLARVEGGLEFPRASELEREDVSGLRFLFRIDQERYFFCEEEISLEPLLRKGYAFMDMKELREGESRPKFRMFAACTGKHLTDWYRDTAFCGRCGKRMEHSKTERAKVCPVCHYTAYPRIMPAVIVGVTNKDRLLLTRYRTGYNHNALIAGFTEIGETLEETVSREVMEEAGIRVKNIRYYKSQPWGVANDILAGFFCDVDGDDTIHVDENELKDAVWTKREDIVLQPDASSLTNEMMMIFKNGEKV